jgi:hypothetical protein
VRLHQAGDDFAVATTHRNTVLNLEIDSFSEYLETVVEYLWTIFRKQSVVMADCGKTALSPHVGNTLFTQQVELDAIHSHAVDDQPRHDVFEKLLGVNLTSFSATSNGHLQQKQSTNWKHRTPDMVHLNFNSILNLWHDEQLDSLALADASHAEGSLSIVSEHHVLPQS